MSKKWIEYNISSGRIISFHVSGGPPIVPTGNDILALPDQFSFKGEEYIGAIAERAMTNKFDRQEMPLPGIHWRVI